MNKLTIIGNLVKDPELRTTQDGVNVCSFRVAVNRRNGRNHEPEVDYFDVSVWREKGENCAKYLFKGRKVCVIGAVSCRTWESNGKHGASMEIKSADEVEFLSPKDDQVKIDPQSGMQQVEDDDMPY